MVYGELYGLMAERKIKIKDISELLGIARSTAKNKLDGINEFTVSEACRISDFFGLNDEQIRRIFFTRKVS